MSERVEDRERVDAAVVDDLLKLGGGFRAGLGLQIGLAPDVDGQEAGFSRFVTSRGSIGSIASRRRPPAPGDFTP